MDALIMARVSTEEQKLEGQSIPAQLEKSRRYAERKNLKVIKEFQFDESSLKEKRERFEDVMNIIKKRKKSKIALITETVDRLQRSFKESVMLEKYRKKGILELHFIRENLIISKNSNSSEIQRWDLAVFSAKNFVLQVSDNVKRTNEYKVKRGEWPGKAPVGYMNITKPDETKELVIDKSRSGHVIKVFEMYASGNASVRTIHAEMKKLGLTSNRKNSKPLSPSMIHNLLQNPFYYGMMKVKGTLYPHRYPPLRESQIKCVNPNIKI